MNDKLDELKTLIDDGQRAYRLNKYLSACPDFESPLYKRAWKAGYYSAIHRISVDCSLSALKKEFVITH